MVPHRLARASAPRTLGQNHKTRATLGQHARFYTHMPSRTQATEVGADSSHGPVPCNTYTAPPPQNPGGAASDHMRIEACTAF